MFGLSFLLLASAFVVDAFDVSAKSNVVVYWGQQGGSLATVCADPSVDVVALSFLTDFFSTGGLPVVNFAGSCSGPTFSGTNLLECSQIGQDIATCQAAGKIVLLSLGGELGDYGFSSASEAQTFATTLWNVFGGGSSSTRPFGTSIVDGFDLDIENKQEAYYPDFITALRSLYATGSKQYYITGAPQCVYPDASLGTALASSPFDMVFVQFYNNPPCSVAGSGFNYATWQSWASSSANPNVKVYVGVPASSSAAGSGYITPDALALIIDSVSGQPNFGGVMMWDANRAFANVENGVHYAQAAKNALVAAVGSGSTGSTGGETSKSVALADTSVADATTPIAGLATSAVEDATSVMASVVAVSTTQAPVNPVGGTVATASPVYIATTLKTVTVKTVSMGAALAVEKNRVATTVSDDSTESTQTISSDVISISVATNTATSSSETCTAGTVDCINGQFAQCVDGTYVLTSCPSGTTCTKIPIDNNNVVVTCDYIFSSKARRNVRRHGHGRKHVLIGADHRS